MNILHSKNRYIRNYVLKKRKCLSLTYRFTSCFDWRIFHKIRHPCIKSTTFDRQVCYFAGINWSNVAIELNFFYYLNTQCFQDVNHSRNTELHNFQVYKKTFLHNEELTLFLLHIHMGTVNYFKQNKMKCTNFKKRSLYGNLFLGKV